MQDSELVLDLEEKVEMDQEPVEKAELDSEPELME